VRRLKSRITLIAFLWTAATVAYAQEPIAIAPASAQFLPRFDFAVSFAALSSPDPRFSYDSVATLDLDVLDYVKGRTSVLAQYNVVMGNQQQLFDPTQGNYSLEGSSSLRFRNNELAVVFHHVSRHLSDRPNPDSVSFNTIGGRVMRHIDLDGTSFDVRGDLEKVIRHAFVDYTWIAGLHAAARKPINSTISMFSRGDFMTYGVNKAIAGRTRQNDLHFEGGIRVRGGYGAVEFFGGWEHVVDAYPLERGAKQWTFAGLRLTGK
jgi:hypothetical protein